MSAYITKTEHMFITVTRRTSNTREYVNIDSIAVFGVDSDSPDYGYIRLNDGYIIDAVETEDEIKNLIDRALSNRPKGAWG